MNLLTLYLIVIFSIALGITGIILLILGLAQKKQKLWLSGAIALFISLALCIMSIFIGVKKIINKTKVKFHIKQKVEKQHDNKGTTYYYNYNNEEDEDSDEEADDNLAGEFFTKVISGDIEDSEENPVLIKIFVQNNLIDKGIQVEEVRKAEDNKIISLHVIFDNNFKGKLKLNIFGLDKAKLGSSDFVEIDQKAGIASYLDFEFKENVCFSDADYCTLIEYE
jgi:hypothetical protein